MTKLSSVDSWAKQAFDHILEHVQELFWKLYTWWRMIWQHYPEIASLAAIVFVLAYMFYNNRERQRFQQHTLQDCMNDETQIDLESESFCHWLGSLCRAKKRKPKSRTTPITPKSITESWFRESHDSKKKI